MYVSYGFHHLVIYVKINILFTKLVEESNNLIAGSDVQIMKDYLYNIN